MGIRYIDPLSDLGPLLLNVEKPARYSGGEYGRLAKKDAILKTVIAFPDLYEIGMSNQALRILYNRLNETEGISCDRAFAAAPDFEALLLKLALPLYGLDTGISLKDADILMFTLGYELGITGVFSMLDISGIPLRSRERGNEDPIVIMGGPCVSNPLPYSAFADAFWIGEAEGGFFDLARSLAEIKKSGGGRADLLEKITAHGSVWAKGKGRATRAIDREFSAGKNRPAVFPVPSMKVVHHHGAVEIMRGCANGCRFCHAGYWYRPMRQKSAALIETEIDAFIRLGGYREITLSSLSSGDYQHLDCLIKKLNGKFRKKHISFQLPSLRVSTFSLGLLEEISMVRKSGLTFAVETPLCRWQMAINKQVSGEDVVSIIKEAKRRGWRGAKFYFMIGLPLEDGAEESAGVSAVRPEEEEIVSFIERTARLAGMRFNINIGTFVPKPHTPFQWAAQISREAAEKKLNFLRVSLKSLGHKVGIQDPLISEIEGIISRGDERAGDLLEEAFRSGCRLDSWNEYLKRDVWESLLEKNRNLVTEILGKKEMAKPLPWADVFSGTTENYFKHESDKTITKESTLPCMENCNKPCGICDNESKIVKNNILCNVDSSDEKGSILIKNPDPDTFRILFSFSKQGNAVFHPHLGLLEIFSMAFIRADIPIQYSKGFNPLPKLEIASPLSLGIRARAEIATIDTEVYMNAEEFINVFNSYLPEGIELNEAINVIIRGGEKKHSVSSLLWGYAYAGNDGNMDFVGAKEEKSYRVSRIGENGNVYSLERLSVLAKDGSAAQRGTSYFDVYRKLYRPA